MKPNRALRLARPRGFSLIATLSMMLLITLIALGLLSLSTVTIRASDAGSAMATARASARLALMMAIGDLQKMAGADQRVTSDGSRDTDTARKHWTGVWRTTKINNTAEVPVIRWDDAASSLLDYRSNGEVTPEKLFQGWLVSGADNPSADKIEIVSVGSVKEAADVVKVPLVPVSDSRRRTGSYAYWVSDESLKAAFGVPDYLVGKQPGAPGDDGYKRMVMPQNVGLEVWQGLEEYEKATAENLEKVSDLQQAELAGPWDSKIFPEKFHSLAATSYSVLADSMRSGLKRDLSVYFEDGGAAAKDPLLPKVDDNTPLLEGTKRQTHGPRFGVLRSWAKLADDVQADGAIAPRASTNTVSLGYTQGGMLPFAKLPNMQLPNMPIGPAMASVQLYTRFSYVRGYMVVNLYPRIVLWNPYNAKLSATPYSMDLNFAFSDDGHVLKRDPATGNNVRQAEKYDYTPRGTKDWRMRLNIEATEFAPGEALVFCPKIVNPNVGGNSMQLANRTGSGNNLMSATTNPADMSNFYITLRTFPNMTAPELPAIFDHNDSDGYYWVDGMDWWENNTANGLKMSLHLGEASSYSALMNNPVIQMVDMDNWKRGYEGRFNPGRWRVGGQETIYDYEATPRMIPWARTCYGFRYKWPVEVNPYDLSGTPASRFWEAGMQVDYNLRAPFCYRSPYDNITDNGESHHWYMWGPFCADAVASLDYNSSQLAVWKGPNGNYRASPFFGAANATSDHVYPKYDLPYQGERVVSVGRFQQTPLTPFVWHPAYAVGSSWVPSNIKMRERSADPAATVSGQWSSEAPFLPAWYRQSIGNDETVYDLSYEANYELWDRYFLSGSLKSERAGFIAQPTVKRLPNSRLVPRTDVKVTESRLNEYYGAASQLMLAGGFNVNSMDVEAWKAVLSSLRDLTVPSKSSGGAASDEGTPYSRFLTPQGGPVTPADPYKVDSWIGYRRLSDTEVNDLARKLVDEVKARGPFLSVSDFVNRRLVPVGTGTDAERGLMGALQRAIANTNINQSLDNGDSVMRFAGYQQASYEPGNNAAAWAEKTHLKNSKSTGMPTYLQQGDILQSLGSTLTARGDTFRVRGYGESRDASNKVLARSWCEAVVQRLPDYLDPSNSAELPAFSSAGTPNPSVNELNRRFGRRYQIVSFRWMTPSEV